MSSSLQPLWMAACQASLSLTVCWSSLRLRSTELAMLSNRLIPSQPLLSCPPSFPTWGPFLMRHLFTAGSQSIGTSASVLPVNIQSWFPLGLTGLISLLSKGLSRVFSSTTVWKHHFLGTQPSLWSNSHLYMTTRKTITLTMWTCSCVVAF